MTIEELHRVLIGHGLQAAETAVARATVAVGFTVTEPLWVELEDLRDATERLHHRPTPPDTSRPPSRPSAPAARCWPRACRPPSSR